ncbi:MAG: ArsR/SmtB family transcription factor [Planctomycetota bacterium]
MPDEDRAFKDAVYEQFARIGKSVDSPRRIELLDLLAQTERTVEKLAELTGMSEANTSRHLRILLNARLVKKDKRGKHAWYSIADESLYGFFRALRNVAESRLAEVERLERDFFGSTVDGEAVDRETLLRRARAGEATVLDVRPEEEYDAGHIPGAVSIPLEELEERLDDLPADSQIVAYCRGPYCVLASRAVEILESRGFRATRFKEGPPDWAADGYRVEKSIDNGERVS